MFIFQNVMVFWSSNLVGSHEGVAGIIIPAAGEKEKKERRGKNVHLGLKKSNFQNSVYMVL